METSRPETDMEALPDMSSASTSQSCNELVPEMVSVDAALSSRKVCAFTDRKETEINSRIRACFITNSGLDEQVEIKNIPPTIFEMSSSKYTLKVDFLIIRKNTYYWESLIHQGSVLTG